MKSEQANLTVTFRRTGGLFAGNVLTASVSLRDLDQAQRADLQHHLDQADLATLAERSPIRGAGADTYQYDIVVDDGARRSQVVVAQTAVPDSLRPLIDWLEQRAGRRNTR